MGIVGVWSKARLYAGGYDFTGDLREIRVDDDVEVLDATTFGNGSKVYVPGIRNIALACAGFLNNADDAQHEQSRDNLGLANIPVTVMMSNVPAEGDPALLFLAAQASYQHGGAHGQVLPFSFQAQGGNVGYPLIRGFVLNPGTVAVSATGQTAGSNNLGAIAAGQYLYAALHVTEVSSGDGITITVESDDNSGFTTPTTRATFTAATAIGGQYLTRVAGPITDTYWRAKHTLTGAAISIKYACAIGKA